MMRQAFAIFAIVTMLIGCAPAQAPTTATTGGASGNNTVTSSSTGEKRAEKQTIKYAQQALPANLNLETSELWRELYLLVYDPVVMMNGDHNIVPWAADKWELVNPTTWRIHLRNDLVFTNGDKLTADDVVFTANFILENHTPPISQLQSLAEAKKVDDYTVDFISKTNDVSTIAGLAYLSIVPKKYFESVGREGFGQKPMGSGPYELTDFRASDYFKFTLKSTKHPFRQPTLTQIEAFAIPEKSAAMAGLRTGELDFVRANFTTEDVTTLKREGFTMETRLTGNTFILFPQSESESRDLPTKNVKVRQALNYAIDRDALSNTFYFGEAKPTGQLGAFGSPFYDPSIPAYTHDVAKAKQLLAEAGYPNGFTLQNGMDFNRSNTNADFWVTIQSNLKDIGVNVELNGLEYGVYSERFRNLKPKGDLYSSALYDTNGFNSTIRTYFGCKTPYDNEEGRLWWCNKEFDALHAQAATEADFQKRTELLRKAAKIEADDVRVIHLLLTPSAMVMNTTVKGFNWNEDRLWTFDSVYRVQ